MLCKLCDCVETLKLIIVNALVQHVYIREGKLNALK